MLTRSRARKENLEKAEDSVLALDNPEKIDFEDSDTESENSEPETMGDHIVPVDTALMDYSRPKIDDIQSSIIHPAIEANNFEIKAGTLQMVQNSVLSEVQLLKIPTCISGILSRSVVLSNTME